MMTASIGKPLATGLRGCHRLSRLSRGYSDTARLAQEEVKKL